MSYLGKGYEAYITGEDKDEVTTAAEMYCFMHPGWIIKRNATQERVRVGWFRWKKQYRVTLMKPIDFEIIRH
jgi:hypothetical protein